LDDGGGERFFAGEDAEFFEGELCGALFGLFFGGAPGAAEGAVADGDADFEIFGVVGAGFVDEDVAGGGVEDLLGVLLKEAFVILLVGGGGVLIDVGVHVEEDEVAGGEETAVDVEGGDDAFEDAGGEGGGSFGSAGHAFADEDEFGETEGVGDGGAGVAADDGGFEFGEVAFEVVGEEFEEAVADDESEDGVTEEFEAFVGEAAVIGDGGVCEGFLEEFAAIEVVAED
jgi:hypothetical protein